MSNGFREVIEIRPKPGRALSFVAVVLVSGGLVSLCIADIPSRWQVVAALALVAAAAMEARSFTTPASRWRTVRATLLPDGSWRVSDRLADPVAAQLSRVWGASLGPVMALEWDCEDGIARRAWLFRPDVPARDWRRLRARLRLA